MSQSRTCLHFLASDGRWYLMLGDYEHAYEEDECSMYGPFKNEDELLTYRRYFFSNPGCQETDDSGTRPPPKDCINPV